MFRIRNIRQIQILHFNKMSTITINKLLSYDDTMTLIRNACVGLDINLSEHDIEIIERGVDYFFSLLKNHAGDRRFCVRISVLFQRELGLGIRISDNYTPAYQCSTTNYTGNGLYSAAFGMRQYRGSFVESITSVEC